MRKNKVFTRIREVVRQIPFGKVTTYGTIAKMVGLKDARVVGWALRGNTNPKVPCHRVVKAGGFLATNYSLGGWQEQKTMLIAEGVSFVAEKQADLSKHFWQKDQQF